MQKPALGTLAMVLVLAALCSCLEDDSASVADRLRACGYLTEGEVGPLPFYAPNECYRECLAEATCEELGQTLCRTSIDLRRSCDERCAFHCKTAGLVALERVCDGTEDCEGGDDERDCGAGTFTCQDGKAISDLNICNGGCQCTRCEDESDCELRRRPPSITWTCENGNTIDATQRCDSYPQCRDGSDERGCARVTPMCPVS